MKRKLLSILAILFMALTAQAATRTVTWNASDIVPEHPWDDSFTKDGITITADMCDFMELNFAGPGTFTTASGKFTKIEVTAAYVGCSGTGWSGNSSKKTWEGEASSSVSFTGDIMGFVSEGNTFTIVFTIEESVAVTGVTLAPTSATLTLGETETVTLTPTVLPADATDKSVTWSSSNEAVATVADGVVTAVAAGEATITVTTTDGAKTATCAVTVAAPAASTYTVTLKEGTEDATSWTITPAEATTTGVAQGTEVTATYNGTKKVKSVKAVKKAKPAATVTTAPTATTGDIVAGSETALVTAGTATGGTMMYKVTTENTQPTTTEGFSATVPTAKTLTAGTYYVWYYVKADATHTDSEISATAVTVTVKAGTPEYYDKLTKINDSFDDQVYVLKQLGRGRTPYNSSLTAAQAYALATYQAAIDGQAVYVIMSSQNSGYDIHYAVSTDASATEHTADLYDICDPDSPAVRMYYVAQ